MPRPDGRTPGQLRPLILEPSASPYAEGSAVCSFGQTRVLCTASVERAVPSWLADSGRGWVTAEYAMLPRATQTRTDRGHAKGGRAQEISRLIGRSLRAAVDLAALDGYTIRLDCDVLVADGGTRTASISGAWVALALAMKGLGLEPTRQVAAISVGKVDGALLTDLCYAEDSRAQVDANLVLSADGGLIEAQATAEKGVFSAGELTTLVDMAQQAAREIFAAQTQAVEG